MFKMKSKNKIIILLALFNLFLLSSNNQVFADSGYKGHWPNEIATVSGGKVVSDNGYIEVYVGAGEEFEKVDTIIPNGISVPIYGSIIKNNEKWSLVRVYDFDEIKIKKIIKTLSNWEEYHKETITKLNNYMVNKDKIELAKWIYNENEIGLSYVSQLKRSSWVKAEYLNNYEKG